MKKNKKAESGGMLPLLLGFIIVIIVVFGSVGVFKSTLTRSVSTISLNQIADKYTSCEIRSEQMKQWNQDLVENIESQLGFKDGLIDDCDLCLGHDDSKRIKMDYSIPKGCFIKTLPEKVKYTPRNICLWSNGLDATCYVERTGQCCIKKVYNKKKERTMDVECPQDCES